MAQKARALSNGVRQAIANEFNDRVTMWPNPNYTNFVLAGVMNGEKVYRPGARDKAMNGRSDLEGIIKPTGRMLAIEIKADKDRMSADQNRWKEIITSRGGLWITAKTVDQCMDELRREIA